MDVGYAALHSRFFRWHSSGDIPDENYLKMMVRLATKIPETKFLAFTKKFELVNAYLDENGDFPENLCVVFSAWGNFMPNNPYHLPVAYVRFKDAEADIPQDAIKCSKYCGDCVVSGNSCWSLKRGQSVCFDEH